MCLHIVKSLTILSCWTTSLLKRYMYIHPIYPLPFVNKIAQRVQPYWLGTRSDIDSFLLLMPVILTSIIHLSSMGYNQSLGKGSLLPGKNVVICCENHDHNTGLVYKYWLMITIQDLCINIDSWSQYRTCV